MSVGLSTLSLYNWNYTAFVCLWLALFHSAVSLILVHELAYFGTSETEQCPFCVSPTLTHPSPQDTRWLPPLHIVNDAAVSLGSQTCPDLAFMAELT